MLLCQLFMFHKQTIIINRAYKEGVKGLDPYHHEADPTSKSHSHKLSSPPCPALEGMNRTTDQALNSVRRPIEIYGVPLII